MPVVRRNEGKVNHKERWIAEWPICGHKPAMVPAVEDFREDALEAVENDEVPLELQSEKDKKYWQMLSQPKAKEVSKFYSKSVSYHSNCS